MILAILSIIAVWLFEVPLPWAITITVFGALTILFDGCRVYYKIGSDN